MGRPQTSACQSAGNYPVDAKIAAKR